MDGSEYIGEWNAQGQKHGQATLTFANKTSYSGSFSNGLFNGYGVLIFNDGSRYEGQFTDGKFHGVGIFNHKNGTQYEGEFKNGYICGEGLLTFADGTHGVPRREGCFDKDQFLRCKKCQPVIQQANVAAETARNQSQA